MSEEKNNNDLTGDQKFDIITMIIVLIFLCFFMNKCC